MSLTIALNKKTVSCHRLITAALLSLSALTASYAQGLSLPDTLKMETVSVTALSPNRVMPFTIISIDTMLKEWNRFSDIGKLFQSGSPVFVKRYGTDGLASLFIRGMSGNHTNVTWNGLNINSTLNGQTDMTLMPLFAADKLTLTMGGGNLKNLSGTMGGSLDLSSLPKNERGVEPTFLFQSGSFGAYGEALSLAASTGKRLSANTRVWFRKSENNFSFLNENAPGGPATLHRVNAAVKSGGFLQDIFLTEGRHSLSAHLWYNDSFRELPSPVTTVQQNLGETQIDRSLRAVMKYDFSGETFKSYISTGYVNDINIYKSDSTNIHGDNRYQTFTSRAVMHYFGNEQLDITLSLANEYNTATCYSYTERKIRNILSSSLSFEYEAGRMLLLIAQIREQMPGTQLLTPEYTAGITFKPGNGERMLIKANFTRNVKFPSFNDLYWNPGGNPSLRPEMSRGGEISFMLQGQKKRVLYSDITTTFYMSDVKDLISWVPVNSTVWSPMNIKEVHLYGGEFSSLTCYNLPVLKLKLAASYNYVGNPLTYIPAHTCNLGLTGVYRNLKFGTTALWNSRCYTNSTGTEWLYGYLINDLLCGYSFNTKPAKVELDLSINNLLNIDYESVRNYPMPLRSICLTLNIKPKIY